MSGAVTKLGAYREETEVQREQRLADQLAKHNAQLTAEVQHWKDERNKYFRETMEAKEWTLELLRRKNRREQYCRVARGLFWAVQFALACVGVWHIVWRVFGSGWLRNDPTGIGALFVFTSLIGSIGWGWFHGWERKS